MCTVLIVVCALVGILGPDLPDFSDPLLVSTDTTMLRETRGQRMCGLWSENKMASAQKLFKIISGLIQRESNFIREIFHCTYNKYQYFGSILY